MARVLFLALFTIEFKAQKARVEYLAFPRKKSEATISLFSIQKPLERRVSFVLKAGFFEI